MFGRKAEKTIRLATKNDVMAAAFAAAFAVYKFVDTYNEYQVSKSITQGKVINGETA